MLRGSRLAPVAGREKIGGRVLHSVPVVEAGAPRSAVNKGKTMKAALVNLLSLVLVLGGSVAEGAPNPKVVYLGREAGIEGPRDFAYLVDMEDVGGEYPIMEFRVGAGDLDMDHYSKWLVPEGWEYAVGEDGPLFDVSLSRYGGCSAIGETANLLKSVSSRCVRFWTDDEKHAVWSFTFGFDYEGSASDVGWALEDAKPAGFAENSFVGVGTYNEKDGVSGPMHGPFFAPEPATFSLLALGVLLVTRRR